MTTNTAATTFGLLLAALAAACQTQATTVNVNTGSDALSRSSVQHKTYRDDQGQLQEITYVGGNCFEASPVAVCIAECQKSLKESCFQLAVRYEGGLGLPVDRAAAERNYRTACQLGSGLACHRLADQTWPGIDPTSEEALGFSLRGCDLGDHNACDALDRYCTKGKAPACTNLGDVYAKGDEQHAPDPQLSVSFFTKACKAGSQEACQRVDQMRPGDSRSVGGLVSTTRPSETRGLAPLRPLAGGHPEPPSTASPPTGSSVMLAPEGAAPATGEPTPQAWVAACARAAQLHLRAAERPVTLETAAAPTLSCLAALRTVPAAVADMTVRCIQAMQSEACLQKVGGPSILDRTLAQVQAATAGASTTPSATRPIAPVAPTRTRSPADVAFAKSLVGRDLSTLLDEIKKHKPINERFAALVGSDYPTSQQLGVAFPTVKLGDSIVGEACREHMCGGSDSVIVVVDLSTGLLHYGTTVDNNMRVYSEDPVNLPAPLTAWQKDPGGWNNPLMHPNAQPGKWKR